MKRLVLVPSVEGPIPRLGDVAGSSRTQYLVDQMALEPNIQNRQFYQVRHRTNKAPGASVAGAAPLALAGWRPAFGAIAITWMFGAAPNIAAMELKPDKAFVELAAGSASTHAASAGVGWTWGWRRGWRDGTFSASTEIFASHWKSTGTQEQSLTLLGALPLLRYSTVLFSWPVFIEGGVGLSVMDRNFETPQKHMGSSWNFYDTLAIGTAIGTERISEVSLRISHLSNAGIRKPNPGENFIQVRVTMHF
jgi:lipid A 3-O-deacylase